MSIVMASVDHTSAGIEVRERFSFTESGVRQAVREISGRDEVDGVVLLSTCNRTELYLTGEISDPAVILRETAAHICGSAGKIPDGIFRVKSGEDAVQHLMEVACGLRSKILCEDQIITQVRKAAVIAREEKTCDAVLETLFRLAVTAAKRAKTSVSVRAVPTSAAVRAAEFLEQTLGGLGGRRAMVIGNGEMGRLCADSLVEMGCHVTVTLRTYRHGETIVPRGCDTIPYEERELLIPNVDIIVSATASPHFTLTKAMLEQAPRRPKILVDLAVPRDIDPEAEELEGVQCYNIDTIGSGEEVDGPELGRVRKIIAQETEHFYDWLNIHNCRDSIENIKRITFKKVSGGLMSGEVSEEERERVELAVYKTIDLLMYSIKEQLSPELVEGIEQHILTSKNGGKPIE